MRDTASCFELRLTDTRTFALLELLLRTYKVRSSSTYRAGQDGVNSTLLTTK